MPLSLPEAGGSPVHSTSQPAQVQLFVHQPLPSEHGPPFAPPAPPLPPPPSLQAVSILQASKGGAPPPAQGSQRKCPEGSHVHRRPLSTPECAQVAPAEQGAPTPQRRPAKDALVSSPSHAPRTSAMAKVAHAARDRNAILVNCMGHPRATPGPGTTQTPIPAPMPRPALQGWRKMAHYCTFRHTVEGRAFGCGRASCSSPRRSDFSRRRAGGARSG